MMRLFRNFNDERNTTMYNSPDKQREDKLDGVVCSVSSCMYHTKDNACTARHIQVGTEEAHRQAETLCATYHNKGSL